MFVTGLAGLAAAVLPVRRWDGVDGRALFTGGMGGVGRVGQTCPGLSCVVVELHEAEDQVCGNQLKLVRWVCDDITAKREKYTTQLNIHLFIQPSIHLSW